MRVKRLRIHLLATATLVACGVAVTEPLPSTPPALDVLEATTLYPTPTVPSHLRLARIDAAVVPLTLTGTELVPHPTRESSVGGAARLLPATASRCWSGTPSTPAAGKLDDLESVPVGAMARVSGIAYEVTSVRVVSKPALAARAADLFSQHGKHRLVVVTCEDYDATTGEYASNVVLTAEAR